MANPYGEEGALKSAVTSSDEVERTVLAQAKKVVWRGK